MVDVTIAIPTFRRPIGLARLLTSLASLRTDANVTILVGDNDYASHAGLDLCVELQRTGYRWPLEMIIVEPRGIAQNRSALVAHALQRPQMQFLAMLDDDEWVEPHWLDRLLRTCMAFGADVVEGPVIGISDDTQMPWPYDGVASHRGATSMVDMLEGAGNILIRRKVLEYIAPPHFDPQFALTGGEDKDFFFRLKRFGARFAWSAEGVSHTVIPPSRANVKWALARAYGVGNSDMRVFLKHCDGLGAMAIELGKIALALLLSPPLALILAASPRRRLGALRKFFRAVGKTAALFGSDYQEYSVIHGE